MALFLLGRNHDTTLSAMRCRQRSCAPCGTASSPSRRSPSKSDCRPSLSRRRCSVRCRCRRMPPRKPPRRSGCRRPRTPHGGAVSRIAGRARANRSYHLPLLRDLQAYRTTLKALIHEEFGDDIMSAIDFDLDLSRQPDPAGDRVRIVMTGKFLNTKRLKLRTPPHLCHGRA